MLVVNIEMKKEVIFESASSFGNKQRNDSNFSGPKDVLPRSFSSRQTNSSNKRGEHSVFNLFRKSNVALLLPTTKKAIVQNVGT